MNFRVLFRVVELILIAQSWRSACYAALPDPNDRRTLPMHVAGWPRVLQDAERELSPEETRHTNASQSGYEGNSGKLNSGGESAGGRQPSTKMHG
eukprot:516208-Prorocentrum_minimum.AAC.1